MNKQHFISAIAVGLLISNLVLVGVLFFRKPPHPQNEGPRSIIIERLRFNEQQIREYDVLIQEHRKSIHQTNDEVMNLKQELYKNIITTDSVSNNKKDSLIQQITLVQQRIEHIHYAHFTEIKKMCAANQQQAFAELTNEIAMLFAPPKPMGKP